MSEDDLRVALSDARDDLAAVLMPSGRIVSLDRLRERQENARWWVALYERQLAEMNCAVVAHN